MRKWRKNDVCMIIKNGSWHKFKIGQLVVMDKLKGDNYFIGRDDNDFWWVGNSFPNDLFYIGRL